MLVTDCCFLGEPVTQFISIIIDQPQLNQERPMKAA